MNWVNLRVLSDPLGPVSPGEIVKVFLDALDLLSSWQGPFPHSVVTMINAVSASQPHQCQLFKLIHPVGSGSSGLG